MRHTCPRRAEVQRDVVVDADTYDLRTFNQHAVLGCSYCGSMDPDVVMEGLRTGGLTLGPTDKGYKVYIHEPDASNEYGTGDTIGKFYFQHTTLIQRLEFIRLHNAGTLKIGYPGHFYSPPFFTRRA